MMIGIRINKYFLEKFLANEKARQFDELLLI